MIIFVRTYLGAIWKTLQTRTSINYIQCEYDIRKDNKDKNNSFNSIGVAVEIESYSLVSGNYKFVSPVNKE